MSRIGCLALLFCLAAHTALAQQAAPAADAAAQPAAQEPAAQATEKPAAPSAEAVAARQAFDALQRQWEETISQITALQAQRRDAKGEDRAKFDKQVADLYAHAD